MPSCIVHTETVHGLGQDIPGVVLVYVRLMQALIIRPMGVQTRSALFSLGNMQFPFMSSMSGVFRIPCTSRWVEIEVNCGVQGFLPSFVISLLLLLYDRSTSPQCRELDHLALQNPPGLAEPPLALGNLLSWR